MNTFTPGDQEYFSVADLSGGGFAATSESFDWDVFMVVFRCQIFDSGGNKVGNEFTVSRFLFHAGIINLVGWSVICIAAPLRWEGP